MARTHHEAPPEPKGELEPKPDLKQEAAKRRPAPRRTKPPVPNAAMRAKLAEKEPTPVTDEDIEETTELIGDKDIEEEMEVLGDEDLMEVKDEAPAAAKDEADYEEMSVTAAPDDQKASEPEKPVVNRVQPWNPSQKLRDDASEALDLEHLKKGKIDRATYRMNRLDRTAAREQAADKGKEAGTSLQLEVMDAWKNYDAAKENFEKVGDEYIAAYQRALELVNDPKADYDEGAKEYLLQNLLRRDGLQDRHTAALDAYWNAERAYLDRYAQWEHEIAMKAQLKKQYEADFDALVNSLAPAEPKFSSQEEAWFKQGEEEDRMIAAARAEIEGESLVETPAEIEANVAEAEAMLKSGDLNPATFDLAAYRTLMKEKARLDTAIEHGAGARLRGLNAELKSVQGELSGYEEQIQSVYRERRGVEQPLTAREKGEIAAKPWRKQELPQGSGTSVHQKKKGFFARLFGR